VIEKREPVQKTSTFEEGVAAGETSSQVLEENAYATPLSPTGKEMRHKETRAVQDETAGVQVHQDNSVQSMPIKVKKLQTNVDVQDLENLTEVPVMAVTTRAQARRAQQQLVADQAATASSGVVLTPVSTDQSIEEPASVCDEPDSDCEVADESKEDTEEIVITREKLIEYQQQDIDLQEILLAAEDPDSMFLIKEGSCT